MCRVASSPIFFQVFPPSSDLYAPSPHEELCRLFGSPVPTHTTDGSDGAMAMSPIVDTLSLSNTGSHVVPLFVVSHTPPEAVPTNTMFGLLSTTAKSSMRPPIVAGPISRNSRFLNLSVGLGWSPDAACAVTANAPRDTAQTRIFRRAFHAFFISIPLVARPGMILRLDRALAVLPPRITSAQQPRFPSAKGGIANLEAKTQARKGDVTTADGDVDIHYGDTRLRADHVEYNSRTYEATATGHVHLDYGDEHLDAEEAHYNVSTGHGSFHNVRGNVKVERRPNPAILVSDNPLYFEARDVERLPGDVYLIHRAWITICDPQHPKWQFYAPNARIRLDKTVALVTPTFRLFRFPLPSLPYPSPPPAPHT